MRRYLEALKEVANTGSAKVKGSLLKKADSPILRDILYYAYSPTVTFGVGAVDFETGGIDSAWDDVQPLEFLTLARQLASRELTGNAAEIAVRQHIEKYPGHLRSMVRDIFAQRLSIGMDAKRINAALCNTIPVFGVMLAYEYESGRLDYPVFISPKLDGMRAVAIHDEKGVAMFSRRGTPIVGVPHIVEAIRLLSYGVYDGELMHPDGFQTTVSVCRRENPLHPDFERVSFHIFDRVDTQEWDSPKKPASHRFEALQWTLQAAEMRNPGLPLKLVKHFRVSNSQKLQEWHKHFVSEGYEGTMIQGDLPYVKKRSWSIMKLKDFLTLDAKVIGWEPGDTTGKFKHCMGRLICEDLKTGVDFKVGSGFVDSDREITDGWIGKFIEVKYQNWTDPDESGKVRPRFPVYIRTRTDLE